MTCIAQFKCILFASIVCLSAEHAWGASSVIADQRDGQVLQTFLLHLLADPEFDMTGTPTNGAVIVLHTRTPGKTGHLKEGQMHVDTGKHLLPRDAVQDLRNRNSRPDAKPNSYDAIRGYFTNLIFSREIIVADLGSVWSQPIDVRAFKEAYPKAKGWVETYLPGYSVDGTSALVRANVGPSPHGATVTAELQKSGDGWIVKWHHIAWYA